LIDELRAWLEQQGADAAWISDPVSIAYLTGFRCDPHERLMGLGLGSRGPVLVVPGLEAESAAAARGVEVAAWRDGEDPFALAARALGGARTLAVEKAHLTLSVAERLQQASGAARLIDAGARLREMRLVKQPGELDRLERAARVTDDVCRRILAALRPGRSELETARELDAMIGAATAGLAFQTIVQSGPNSALPHLRPGGRRLAPGDLVLLDFGAAVDGYHADITRMAVIGEPDQRQREVHRVVLEAHDAAIAAVRPGVTAGQVDAAARAVIAAAGLGDHFIHRVGHGLGLEVHEDPSLDPGSDLVLSPGMVFTVEPGVYIPGWGGVRIEDDVAVEEAGARLLTHTERSLRVVPA